MTAQIAAPTTRQRAPILMAGLVLAGIGLILFGPRHSAAHADEALLLDQARAGEPVAELQLALDYRDGRLGFAVDHAAEARWLTRAAQAGNADAAALLGDAYNQGEGVRQDSATAQHWWLQAAQAGNSHAEAELGMALARSGDSLAQRYAGRNWVARAAAQGDPQARTYLGIDQPASAIRGSEQPGILTRLEALFDGLTMGAQSVDQLKSRALNGDAVAQYQLAMHYRDGAWGVERDPKVALGWLEMSARQGNPVAMATLADAYAQGTFGLTRDPAQAQAWRQRAAAARSAGPTQS